MNSEPINYYSHGKLLLTAEYVVLDGANALALPTKFGQSLLVEPFHGKRKKNNEAQKLTWKSITNEGDIWFEATFEIHNNEILHGVLSDCAISKRLLDILNTAKKLNPKFLTSNRGFNVTSTLEFPQNWGLGSSSTLINNIANWANIDAYHLLELTFGGSGYDIACAQHDAAITYQLNNYKILKHTSTLLSTGVQDDKRRVNVVNFTPPFKEHLYFVHLNKKQDSREGIAHYKSKRKNLSQEITKINSITQDMIACASLSEFETLIEQHEKIISNIIQIEPIKKRLFNDFKGAIKSLGAWGGDFVLVASNTDPKAYFKAKGYSTILSYNEMILTS